MKKLFCKIFGHSKIQIKTKRTGPYTIYYKNICAVCDKTLDKEFAAFYD